MKRMYRYHVSIPDIPFGGEVCAESEEEAFKKAWELHVTRPTSVEDVIIIFLGEAEDNEGGDNMNIPMDWIHEIINTNKMAIGDNKQVESVDIFFEPNYKGEECPPCGWNHMRFNYEPIGVEHKSWTYTHPER